MLKTKRNSDAITGFFLSAHIIICELNTRKQNMKYLRDYQYFLLQKIKSLVKKSSKKKLTQEEELELHNYLMELGKTLK